jgi:hypothetical protein
MKKVLLISLMVSGAIWAAEGEFIDVALSAEQAAQKAPNVIRNHASPYTVTENDENLVRALSGKAYAGDYLGKPNKPLLRPIPLYRHVPINENEVQGLLTNGALAERPVTFRKLLKNGTLTGPEELKFGGKQGLLTGNLLDLVTSRIETGEAPNAAVITALIAHGAKPTNFALQSLLDSSADSSIPAFDALFSSGKDRAFIDNDVTKETMQDAKNSLARLKNMKKNMGSKFSAEDAQQIPILERKLEIYNSYNSIFSRFKGVIKRVPAQ